VSKKDRFELIGNTIAGTFRVDDVVAEGGFGVVYRAYHLHFRSPVALKCLKIPGELSDEERQSFLEQFRSEAEIQFRLSGSLPNIVRPLHVDAVHSDSGEFIPIMALEWLEGQSFEKIIEERTFADKPPMALGEAMDLIGPAAQALHQAHHFEADGERLTVVHRDIKPDNLFVTEVGGRKVVKLLDFGISKVRRAATQLAGHFSQTGGQAPFSPAYGAPEQWVPKRFGQTGPWTDVWGLALTLVEIIKGDAVIVGDHQAMMGTALDPTVRPSPRQEGVAVSDDVESVFLKALSIDPRYRYQSIEAFWEALGAAVHQSGSLAYDETPSGRRIPLPRMSVPTPWTPPNQALLNSKTPTGKLPPMMAPALMSPTDASDAPAELESRPSYPIDPESDLQPLPAAPTPWEQFEPEIPPIAEALDGSPRSERLPTAPPYEANDLPEEYRSDTAPRREPSLKIELAPVSDYPDVPAPDEDLSEVEPLPLSSPKPQLSLEELNATPAQPRQVVPSPARPQVPTTTAAKAKPSQSRAKTSSTSPPSSGPSSQKPSSRRKAAVVPKREPSSPNQPVIPDLELTPATKQPERRPASPRASVASPTGAKSASANRPTKSKSLPKAPPKISIPRPSSEASEASRPPPLKRPQEAAVSRPPPPPRREKSEPTKGPVASTEASPKGRPGGRPPPPRPKRSVRS